MIRKLAALLLVAALAPAAARANAFQTFGPHLGFSTDPSQVVFGGQLQMGDVAPDIDFVPGIDVGLGDNVTLISLNGDFHYRFVVQDMTWQPYAGAGIAIHFFTWDNPGPGFDNSATRAEGTIVGGADVPTKNGSRFFVEGKIGLGDGPSFKAMAGWHFKLH